MGFYEGNGTFRNLNQKYIGGDGFKEFHLEY